MKKILLLIVMTIGVILVSCDSNSIYYYGCIPSSLANYEIINKFAIIDDSINYSEDEYIVAALVGGSCEVGPQSEATYVHLDYQQLSSLNIISREDANSLKQKITHYWTVNYVIKDGQLKVLLIDSKYPGREKFIFDCLNDFGLINAINHFNKQLDIDIKEEIKTKFHAVYQYYLSQEPPAGEGNIDKRFAITHTAFEKYPFTPILISIIDNVDFDNYDSTIEDYEYISNNELIKLKYYYAETILYIYPDPIDVSYAEINNVPHRVVEQKQSLANGSVYYVYEIDYEYNI